MFLRPGPDGMQSEMQSELSIRHRPPHGVRFRRVRRALTSALAGAALLSGCGTESDYANKPRPPAPINITAAISDDEISVSPKTFGAGPIVLIISNQSDDDQEVTFETSELGGSEPGLAPQTTGPIHPRGTATLKVDVRQGTYELSTSDGTIEPVTIEVGASRPSAQNDLLQP